MTFCARHQVEVLLGGLDILRLEETEQDGHAFSGPKHWHTFDILARKPIAKHPSAPASRTISTIGGIALRHRPGSARSWPVASAREPDAV